MTEQCSCTKHLQSLQNMIKQPPVVDLAIFHVLMEVIIFNATHFHSIAKSPRDYTLVGFYKGEQRLARGLNFRQSNAQTDSFGVTQALMEAPHPPTM